MAANKIIKKFESFKNRVNKNDMIDVNSKVDYDLINKQPTIDPFRKVR